MDDQRVRSSISERDPRAADERVGVLIYTRLAQIWQTALVVAMVLILAGAAIALIQDGELPTEIVAFESIPSELIAGNLDALLSAGIALVLATPAAGLLYQAASFLRSGDRWFAWIALSVLAILLISIPIALLVRG